MSRCTMESECRYAIADVRWPISKRACGSENFEAAAILSNKSPPKNINFVQLPHLTTIGAISAMDELVKY